MQDGDRGVRANRGARGVWRGGASAAVGGGLVGPPGPGRSRTARSVTAGRGEEEGREPQPDGARATCSAWEVTFLVGPPWGPVTAAGGSRAARSRFGGWGWR